MMTTVTTAAQQVKARARELGFDAVGIARPDYGHHVQHFQDWLAQGRQAGMEYLARTADRRADLQQVLPGVQSVVCVAMSYAPADARTETGEAGGGRISRYALNADYHEVLTSPLEQLATFIRETVGGETKVYVDTGPVLERALAESAGLGWIGRNTNLIIRRLGSWVFLGVVLTTAELPPDTPHAHYCSSCQACLQDCPTGALVGPHQLDARRCLSYLTIEHKGALPRELRPALGNRIYGCDTCQEACPWNLTAAPSRHQAFAPRNDLTAPQLTELLALTPEAFRKRFHNSPILRLKRKRLLRNVAVALGNCGDRSVVSALIAVLGDEEPLIRQHAAWALGQLGGPEAAAALQAQHASEPDPETKGELDLALKAIEATKR